MNRDNVLIAAFYALGIAFLYFVSRAIRRDD